MLYILAWRDAHPDHSHSDTRCRKIVAATATDGFTATEKAKFQMVTRADLSTVRPYHALNGDDLMGALLTLDPQDAPKKWTGTEFVAWTQNEMDAGA